jgi:hypothetical protein
MKEFLAVSFAMLFAVGSAFAQEQAETAAVQVEDVEELLDNIDRYVDTRVSVSGEIEEHIDSQSFVLESGGLFNDEIVVVVPQGAEGLDLMQLREDSDVVVTGTLRTVSRLEIEREYGWDLDPEIEVELEDVEVYLVADRIGR